MNNPSLFDKNKAIPMRAPRMTANLSNAEEIRVELPFPGAYEDFLYLSKFWYEKWYTPTQYHDHFELCYVCEGEGWFILEGMLYPVRPGDLFLTKPGEVHCGGSNVGSSFLVYAVGFRLDPTESLANGLYKMGLPRVVRDAAGGIRQHFDRMLDEIERPAPYGAEIVRGSLTLVLALLLRLYGEQRGGRGEEHPLGSVMIQALERIHSGANYTANIDRLAREVGLSRAQLDKQFKRHMGVPAGEYARNVRLERAKRLLRLSREPIAEIAERLEFDSPQSFSVFFKRHAGMSPQQYRSGQQDRDPGHHEENR